MTNSTDAQDAIDMAQLSAGTERALNELMDRHSERLFHYLIRILHNEDDAADIAQETFVRVYQNRGKFNTQQKFSTWLYAIATNLARDRIRWRARHPTVPLDEIAPDSENSTAFAHESPTPSDEVESMEFAASVRRSVGDLPEELRMPLILAEYEGMAHAQIADILKCSLKAVETRIYRARKILRKTLEQFI